MNQVVYGNDEEVLLDLVEQVVDIGVETIVLAELREFIPAGSHVSLVVVGDTIKYDGDGADSNESNPEGDDEAENNFG